MTLPASSSRISTRERLLQTAVSLFASSGYRGVSMRDLAGAVGITPPALYNHFPNKEALYRAAVETAFTASAERMLAALEQPAAPIDRLQGFVLEMAREVQRHPDLRRLLQRELLDADRAHLAFLKGYLVDRVLQPLMGLMEELAPGEDAFLNALMVIGMTKQYADTSVLRDYMEQSGELERSPEQIAGQVMRLIRPYFMQERT